jgi:hypothetical protein
LHQWKGSEIIGSRSSEPMLIVKFIAFI